MIGYSYQLAFFIKHKEVLELFEYLQSNVISNLEHLDDITDKDIKQF